MITTILKDGTLNITPENGLEAYALQKWLEETVASDDFPKIAIEYLKEDDVEE